MTMSEDIPLNEKCKLVVWMEQFQSAEIVQLRYKKEFGTPTPSCAFIEEIHHLFMTTGSVIGKLRVDSLEGDSEKERSRKVKLRRSSESQENEISFKDCKTESEADDDLRDGEELEGLYSMEDTEDEDGNFVSILKHEIALEDKEYAEISVNECESGLLEGSINSSDDVISCSHCGFKTGDQSSFERHRQAHSPRDFFRCRSCAFTSNDTRLFRTHKKSCTRGNNATLKFDDDLAMQGHLAPEVNCHTCDQCGKAYSSQASLNMHKAYHSKLRPFACGKCDYRFFSQSSLKKHVITHDKVKHLECPHCSFKCSMSGTMVIHSRTHTGEKPYKCKQCSYQTANPSIIRRHMATHTNQASYRCGQCNYKTHKSALLLRHEGNHRAGDGFQCHVCQVKLKNTTAFRYHMKKQHSKQEVLECPFCEYTQTDLALLKVHIRRHTGEKPYGCPEDNCDYRAMRSQDLKKHLAKVH